MTDPEPNTVVDETPDGDQAPADPESDEARYSGDPLGTEDEAVAARRQAIVDLLRGRDLPTIERVAEPSRPTSWRDLTHAWGQVAAEWEKIAAAWKDIATAQQPPARARSSSNRSERRGGRTDEEKQELAAEAARLLGDPQIGPALRGYVHSQFGGKRPSGLTKVALRKVIRKAAELRDQVGDGGPGDATDEPGAASPTANDPHDSIPPHPYDPRRDHEQGLELWEQDECRVCHEFEGHHLHAAAADTGGDPADTAWGSSEPF
jgi:hypothetical protein